jgi:hypothetical protein
MDSVISWIILSVKKFQQSQRNQLEWPHFVETAEGKLTTKEKRFIITAKPLNGITDSVIN